MDRLVHWSCCPLSAEASSIGRALSQSLRIMPPVIVTLLHTLNRAHQSTHTHKHTHTHTHTQNTFQTQHTNTENTHTYTNHYSCLTHTHTHTHTHQNLSIC